MDMKLLKSCYLVVTVAAALTACSDDDKQKDPNPGTSYDVISFEVSEGIVNHEGGAVALGECVLEGTTSGGTFQNLYWAKSFSGYEDYLQDGAFNTWLFGTSDQSVRFGSCWSYSSYGDYWGGFVLSGTFNAEVASFDYANQFTVYADKGANSSSICAVGYIDTYTGGYAVPTVELTNPRQAGYCYLASSAMIATYTPIDISRDELWFEVIVTGYLAGKEVGTVDCMLTEGGKTKAGWTKVDLSRLGQVDRLTFTCDSNDAGQWGVNTPGYFALDDLAFVSETKE